MARPKGSKDTKPRKPRLDKLGNAVKDRGRTTYEGKRNPDAPNGYSIHGEPLAYPPKAPRSKAGKIRLQKALEEKGLVPKKEGARPGRPELPIDPEQVKSMAMIGCTMDEMATVLKCSVDTLERKFSGLIAENRDKGKMSLRRLQFRIAQGAPAEWTRAADGTMVQAKPAQFPNAQMAIHLGKHWLGQKDAGPTNNILVANGQQAGPQGPNPYMPNILSPETADILARKFMEICPDPALVKMTVVLDPRNEVQSVQ